ncbi:hypothetical protein PIB30_051022 [Stylosanthes scabra]|uniref:Uncharacterized protein n=1 Tax=Stylosanthes scabra TaxID=79078 RepID=A0ABU6WKJ1_9FABA|nr:hypothetical protein [Stylosanthes scabra]
MGSRVVFSEFEKREKYEDEDEKPHAELGIVKDTVDEFFVNPLHNIRFDPDRPYEIPIKSLLISQVLNSSGNGKSSAQCSHPSRRSIPTLCYSPKGSLLQRMSSFSPAKAVTSLCHEIVGKTVKPPVRWELIPPSEGWM